VASEAFAEDNSHSAMDAEPQARAPEIAFACASCGRKFGVKPEFAGRQAHCPTCEPTVERSAKRALPDVPALHSGAERYVIGAEIARGGMGAVRQATDCDIHREVAIKVLLDQSNAERKLRFIEEAQITGQLEHPNIVPIHELGVDAQGQAFFAMKMVRGKSLAQVLDALATSTEPPGEEVSLRRLLGVFVSVCNAVAYAHSRGVVHRNLTPANIMIGDFGAVYVMDWDLAKVLEDDQAPLPLTLQQVESAVPIARVAPTMGDGGTVVVTSRQQRPDLMQEGAVLGTPVYMSPEQATGDIQAIDERSDIYSLGAILYEILTLHPPVSKSGGYPAILRRVIEGQIAPPAVLHRDRARAGFIPPELAAVAMKALALAPDDRYQSVEFLRRDIELFQVGHSVSAREDSRAELLVKLVKRNKALSTVAAVAAVIFVVAVAVVVAVSLRELTDTQEAYQALQTEQQEKEARTRQAVPALVKAAQLEMHERQFDEALGHVNLALEYDANDRAGRLLKGQLLIAKQDFKGAAVELGQYLAGQVDDKVSELKRLCEEARPADEDKSALAQIAQILVRVESPTVAEELLRRHGDSMAAVRQKLLELYRARLETAWPKGEAKTATGDRREQECTLVLDEYGLHLKLVGANVRDLAPLKGMALNAIELNCPGLSDLSALRGMPLRVARLTNIAGGNLAVLRGMALTELQLAGCHGALDLSALRGMPLTTLVLHNCSGLRDLAMLQGMPLTSVRIDSCHGLVDLNGLQGAPITTLDIRNCSSVRDLAPLKELALTTLDLSGCGLVQDLAALQTMPLAELDIAGTEVRDLAPLRGLPLAKLSLRACTYLKDLSGLKGLKLRTLDLSGCNRVEDLTPLAGMPLNFVELADTGIKNLAPLKGMPLIRISLGHCKALTNLSGLKGMQLVALDLAGCSALADLSALRGMPLNTLSLAGCTDVMDLTPLQGMPLNALNLGGCEKITDLSPLQDAVLTQIDLTDCKSIRTLAGLQAMPIQQLQLSGCTSLVSLDGLKGGSVTTINMVGCTRLESLGGLAGLRLQQLSIQNCPKLQDLSGLKGLPLRMLNIASSTIKDLTPLAGLPLEHLQLERCLELHDLTPLAGMPLVQITLPPEVTMGLDVLRKMPSLQTIDGRPAAQFWKQRDEGK
jgi:serine/threonine protein kinase